MQMDGVITVLLSQDAAAAANIWGETVLSGACPHAGDML